MNQYPCSSCGANVEFAPGTAVLRCPYCAAETPLVPTGARVREHPYAEFARMPREPVAMLAAYTFTCRGCGAVTHSDKISDRCQFCAAPLVADATAGEMVAPEAVLPFVLDRPAVRSVLSGWAASRWFAPNSLKKVSEAESAHSTYVPHWTYDARTMSWYTGQRGTHYWVTETHTVNGNSQTRRVRKTRWHSVSGTVARDFDDVLVAGTGRLAVRHLVKLEPWPLPQAQPYRPEFLAGHETLRYDVEPEAGLVSAKARMAGVIERDCRARIGGDEQRVTSLRTSHFDITFKLMLLPVWLACYLHAGKTYHVMINGRTGAVAGERPYSVAKIVSMGLAALALIAALVVAVDLYLGGAQD
ncbi:hypothetical protein [Actinoplanes sp. NPDC049118]|uniref:hypothetical protein n=1 Tax=Actinoplanes sp. NPDC049118 TaxID=3155769 RepID=UPI0034019995